MRGHSEPPFCLSDPAKPKSLAARHVLNRRLESTPRCLGCCDRVVLDGRSVCEARRTAPPADRGENEGVSALVARMRRLRTVPPVAPAWPQVQPATNGPARSEDRLRGYIGGAANRLSSRASFGGSGSRSGGR